jgi:hypothetical protein
MIAVLVLALAAGLPETAVPGEAPATVSILDFFSDGSAVERGFSDEPAHFERCRLYNCGIPKLDELLDRKNRAIEQPQKK